MTLTEYLQEMIARDASDLFLEAGVGPSYRVHGEVARAELPAPSEAAMRGYLEEVLTPMALQNFEDSPDADVAFTTEHGRRFRINVYLHQGKLGLVARLVESASSLSFDGLHLPEALQELAEKRRGMVLVVGPTGCGKSTTLATMVHHINQTRADHIVTIEDPIEFVHEGGKSLVHQRQVGYDTVSFATALRHVVRQSPDVIAIGELRDVDTMQTALNAALTGHLVLTTLHTTSVIQSIDRILNYFPADARPQAQADLAQTLEGVVAMRLLRRADGKGRVPALEVLLASPLVRRLLREGKFSELAEHMQQSRDAGMMTMNQSLMDLVNEGLVKPEDALPCSPNPAELRLNLQGMFTGS
ncbi:MAG: PilT/PilU family type 4a pilus ATPase, partial [Phycisphaeraceae bacterium]